MAMDLEWNLIVYLVFTVCCVQLTVITQADRQTDGWIQIHTSRAQQTETDRRGQTGGQGKGGAYLNVLGHFSKHISRTPCFPPCVVTPGITIFSVGQTDARTDVQHTHQTSDVGQTETENDFVVRKKRTIAGRYPICPRGCTSCSAVNGCLTCERRYFIFLYRRNMRQIAMCTPSCPPGYFGVRSRHYSKCSRCQVSHCQSCFSRHYCSRCYPPHFAHRGSCLEYCPSGMHFANYSTECRDRVDCLVGPWTAWSTCTPRGRGCPQRRGVRIRSRTVLESPSPNGTACPDLEDRRGCQMARVTCRGHCRRRKRHKRNRKRGRGQKWRKSRRGRGRAHNKKQRKQRRRCRNDRSSIQRCRRRLRCPGIPG